jgi:general secretion pathway protein I
MTHRVSRFPFRSRRAFSLIEVLVALAIFALAGMVLAAAYVNVLSAQNAILRRDAHDSSLQMIREALAAESLLENVEKWNDLKLPDEGKARWRAIVTPTTVADLFDVTLEAEITVDRSSDVLTITEKWRLLRPTWSEPQDRETLRVDARSRLANRTFQ